MRSLICILMILSFGILLGQSSAVPDNVRASLAIQQLSRAPGMGTDIGIYGVPLPPPELLGDPYLEEEWKKTNILLYNNEKVIANAITRLDVHNHGLEIKLNDGNKFIAANNIRSFVWTDDAQTDPRFFINLKEYEFREIAKTGFFEVLIEGNFSLLKLTHTKIIEPNYNVALDVGSQDAKIHKETSLFLFYNKKFYELPNSPKKTVTMLKEHGFPSDLKSADVKSEDGLRLVFDQFNKNQASKN